MLAMISSALLSLGAGLGPVPAEGLDAGLADYRWQSRPVIVFAEAADPRLAAQLVAFRDAAPAMAERDNVVIVDTSLTTPLARRFRPEGFTVILVGKDGGEKLRRTRVVDPGELGALIDTMPMRRNEMRTPE